MNDINTKIIAEQFNKLPENIQTAIVSAEYKNKLAAISKRHSLLIDQAGDLEIETTLTMIGLQPLSDFVLNLQSRLEIDLVEAKEIAMDVSENIFKPIRESLRVINEGLESETNISSTRKNNDALTTENIDRDQVLREIEDPSTINSPVTKNINDSITSQALETLDELPYEQDIKVEGQAPSRSVETKLAGITITPKQTIEAAPEIKLPPVPEKRRPSNGLDPYREPIQ